MLAVKGLDTSAARRSCGDGATTARALSLARSCGERLEVSTLTPAQLPGVRPTQRRVPSQSEAPPIAARRARLAARLPDTGQALSHQVTEPSL